MPSLKYYDRTVLDYKYLVGGLSQETADARYLMSGFRNVIRNGDMSIRQRGNSFTITNLAWQTTLDGWKATHGGGTGAGVTAFSIGAGSMPITDAQYVLGINQATGNATTNYLHLSHFVEDVRLLAGKQATLSFVGYVTSGTANIGIKFTQSFGTGGSPSAEVNILAGTVNLTTTPTRHSLTFLLPSISGKVLGTDNNSWLRIQIWVSGGTDHSSGNGGITVQTNTFCFTDVQLEEGPVATPFERLPVQQQLAWCQRYFQRINGPNWGRAAGSHFIAVGMVESATLANVLYHFPVPMRAIPTLSVSSAANFSISTGAAARVSSAMGSSIAGLEKYLMAVTVATGLTPGHVSMLYESAGSAGSFIDFSAEL